MIFHLIKFYPLAAEGNYFICWQNKSLFSNFNWNKNQTLKLVSSCGRLLSINPLLPRAAPQDRKEQSINPWICLFVDFSKFFLNPWECAASTTSWSKLKLHKSWLAHVLRPHHSAGRSSILRTLHSLSVSNKPLHRPQILQQTRIYSEFGALLHFSDCVLSIRQMVKGKSLQGATKATFFDMPVKEKTLDSSTSNMEKTSVGTRQWQLVWYHKNPDPASKSKWFSKECEQSLKKTGNFSRT